MRATTVIPLLLAFIVTVAYVTAVPTLAYSALVAASIARSGDMGGPLNFVLIPAAGSVIGVIGGIVLVLLSPIFHKSARIALLVPFAIVLFTFFLALAWAYSGAGSGVLPIAFSAFMSFWIGSAALLFIVVDMVTRRIAQTVTSRRKVMKKASH